MSKELPDTTEQLGSENQPPIAPTLEASAKTIENSADKTVELSQTSESENPEDTQVSAEDIESEFDPNLLEAPAAGPSETTTSGPSIDTLSSINTVELQSSATASGGTSTLSNTASATAATIEAPDTSLLIDDTDLIGLTPPQTPASDRIEASVTEDALNSSISGILDNANFESQRIDTEFGTFSINAEGSWTYQLNNQSDAVNTLRAGELRQDSVSITDDSGKTYNFALQINGNNDRAVITGDRAGSVKEASNTEAQNISTASGKLDVNDADTAQATFRSLSNADTNFGSVSMDSDGNWQYSLDNTSSAIDALQEGDTVIDSFVATTADGTTQLVRIAIEGTNDKPILTGENSAQLFVSEGESVSGALNISDPDFGQSLFEANDNLVGNFGRATIDEQGNWSYSLDRTNADVNALQESGILLDSLNARTADGTEVSLIVLIKSQNPGLAETSDSNAPLDVSIALQIDPTEQGIALGDVLSDDQDSLSQHLGGAEQALTNQTEFVAATPMTLDSTLTDQNATLVSLTNLS